MYLFQLVARVTFIIFVQVCLVFTFDCIPPFLNNQKLFVIVLVITITTLATIFFKKHLCIAEVSF